MKLYTSHKTVEAARITGIIYGQQMDGPQVPFAIIQTEDDDEPTVEVGEQFVKRANPQIGSWLIRYRDGYLSVSPAEAFENGYSEREAGPDDSTKAQDDRIGGNTGGQTPSDPGSDVNTSPGTAVQSASTGRIQSPSRRPPNIPTPPGYTPPSQLGAGASDSSLTGEVDPTKPHEKDPQEDKDAH
jgi:hypothetical protein